jgi:hypothetical protein
MIGLRRASDGERLCAVPTANPRAGSFRSVVEDIDRVNLVGHGGACLILMLSYYPLSQRFNLEPRLGPDIHPKPRVGPEAWMALCVSFTIQVFEMIS